MPETPTVLPLRSATVLISFLCAVETASPHAGVRVLEKT